MNSTDLMTRLIKRYGIRRALTLYGAASIAAARGWDVMVGDDAYTRQGVWTWKRDLEAARIDLDAVEWGKFERNFSRDMGEGLARAKVVIREKNARKEARANRGRAAS